MPVSISLVIPTYNRAHLIGETLDSALRQTMPFAEIVVVDDGSTDDTAAVLARYGDRVRVLRSRNEGVQSARNKGVRAATSDYVTFCDSDDLLEPGLVETVGTWLAAHPDIDAVYANLHKFGGPVEPDHLDLAPAGFLAGAQVSGAFVHDIPDLYVRLFTVHYLYPTASTMKRSFFEAIGGYDTRFHRMGSEDGEFTLRVASRGRVAICTTPLGSIRRHVGNDSANELHMVVGGAQILEYALQHHRNAGQYAPAFRREISALRVRAADAAFAQGKFDLARQMFAHDHRRPMGLKFHLKKTITRLPPPLRTLAWKVTQA